MFEVPLKWKIKVEKEPKCERSRWNVTFIWQPICGTKEKKRWWCSKERKWWKKVLFSLPFFFFFSGHFCFLIAWISRKFLFLHPEKSFIRIRTVIHRNEDENLFLRRSNLAFTSGSMAVGCSKISSAVVVHLKTLHLIPRMKGYIKVNQIKWWYTAWRYFIILGLFGQCTTVIQVQRSLTTISTSALVS